MTVTVHRDGAITSLALDRPDAGNRLDAATIGELREQLAVAADADGPVVVVLRAAGPDFSLGRQPTPGAPATPSAIEEEFFRIQGLNEQLQQLPAVTIAALRGQARGAALSLAGRCDVVVAADDARLSFPEVRDGIPATIVLSHYRFVLPRALLGDLVFTGRELTGEEGITAGLVSRVLPAAEVERAVDALAAEIAACDHRTLRTVKRFLVRTDGMDRRDAPALGIATYANEMTDRALARATDREEA